MDRRQCSQFFGFLFVDGIAYTQDVILTLELDLDRRSN